MRVIATLIFCANGILVAGVTLFAASAFGNGNKGDGIWTVFLGAVTLAVLAITIPVAFALLWYSRKRNSNKAMQATPQ